MKWVLVNPHLGPVLGGIQKDMLCLAREFIRQGDRVAFVATYDEFPEGRVDLDRPLTYDLPPGLPVVRLEGRLRTHLRHFQLANPPLWLPGLARAVQRLTPDAVIFSTLAGHSRCCQPCSRCVAGRWCSIVPPIMPTTTTISWTHCAAACSLVWRGSAIAC